MAKIQKYPLKWHEEGLRNSEVYLERKRAEAVRLATEILKMEAAHERTRQRIAEARKKGITELPA